MQVPLQIAQLLERIREALRRAPGHTSGRGNLCQIESPAHAAEGMQHAQGLLD
jgi:hypothetical protein